MGEAKRRRMAQKGVRHGTLFLDQVRHSYEQMCVELQEADNVLDALIRATAGRNAGLERLVNSFPPRSYACAAGCSFCCHQRVLCSPFEIFAAAELILSTWTQSSIEFLKIRINAAKPEYEDGYLLPIRPCSLLIESKCSIYDRRPIACRRTFSPSASICEDLNSGKENTYTYLEKPVLIATAIQIGIDLALIQKTNLDTEFLDLDGGLMVALDDFDATLAEWLSGGAPFKNFQIENESDSSNFTMVNEAARSLNIPIYK